MQLVADKYVKHHETTLYDVTETKRRIETFKDKWDSILWIKHYEEINNMVPDIETIALELGLSNQLATIYLEHYEHIDRYRKKDLDELFCNFDVYKLHIFVPTLLQTDRHFVFLFVTVTVLFGGI